MRACFDGRGRVELLPGRATASQQRRVEEIARAVGYQLLAAENPSAAPVSGSSTNAMTTRRGTPPC